jgi:stage IV sporulation protein FB
MATVDPTTEQAPRSRWALRLGRFAGIDVYLHATFVVLLLWLGSAELVRGKGALAAFASVGYLLALFGCVVLHEFGHALAARRYGIRTRDITLYPIGGVARLEKMPSRPSQELVVALAGPAVNVLIAAILGIVLVTVPGTGSIGEVATFGGAILPKLFAANLFLAAFNLLPAFPMDGGRVLRALLSTGMGRARATRTAAQIGQLMAIVFAALGLFVAPMLLLIAVFVWLGAAQEANATELRSAIHGIPVRQAMETRFEVLGASDTLERGYELVMSGQQVDFPVLDADGSVVGLLEREALARGLAELGPGALVRQVATDRVAKVYDREPLEAALERLAAIPWRTVLVFDLAGRLVGLLTSDNVGELVLFRSTALRAHPELESTSAE